MARGGAGAAPRAPAALGGMRAHAPGLLVQHLLALEVIQALVELALELKARDLAEEGLAAAQQSSGKRTLACMCGREQHCEPNAAAHNMHHMSRPAPT